ncbi:MAG TPA: hypothetical protein PKW71_08490 [Anaerohalosphaeraceae bacterium]|nr:hypothetical protein [Anaerohalosphaeraceae bacterium]
MSMHPSDCVSILKYLTVAAGSRSDYEELAVFHYRNPSPGPIRFIYKLIDQHPQRRLAVPAAGVIVYGPPAANLAIRNQVLGGFFAGLDRADGLALLNAGMLCIRRVIIEPRYRGLGLASRLVKETLPLTQAAMVEAVSTMGCVHPFFVRAQMTEYICPPDVKTSRLQAALETVGIDRSLWLDGQAVQAAIDALPDGQKAFVQQQIERFIQKFPRQRRLTDTAQRLEFVLSKLTGSSRYYLWLNPEKSLPQQIFSLQSAGSGVE